MPGLTDWFQVFRTGTHTDSSGRRHTFTVADLDRAIAEYEPDSAPIVAGHPRTNAPAFGWIKEFRRRGEFLEARCSSVVPEFAELVERGLYKNRSMCFNPDGSFRHVGFLGAAPPAIKGLAQIKFSESESLLMEFNAPTPTEESGLAAQAAPEPAAAQPAAPEPEASAPEPSAETPASSAQTSTQSSAPALSSAQASVEPASGESFPSMAELGQVIKRLQNKVQELEAEISRKDLEQRRQAFSAYAESLVYQGRLKSDLKERLVNTLETLAQGSSGEFAQATCQGVETFKELLNELLPTVKVPLGEFAAASQAAPLTNYNPQEVALAAQRLIREEAKSGQTLTPSQAVNRILQGGAHA